MLVTRILVTLDNDVVDADVVDDVDDSDVVDNDDNVFVDGDVVG